MKPVSFTNLEVWQEAHNLVIAIYKATSTKDFEKYDSLANQIQRAAVSVTSNIAEGFGRQHQKDKNHFYVMARGSMYELQSQLLVCKDIGRMRKEDFSNLADQSTVVLKLLHGLIRSIKRKPGA